MKAKPSKSAVLSKVKGHYFLIVEAWDGAVDPRRSRLTLSVTVLDVDDNSPVFAQQRYNVSIPENSPKDKVILQLRVSGGWLDAGWASCRSMVVFTFNRILSELLKVYFGCQKCCGCQSV